MAKDKVISFQLLRVFAAVLVFTSHCDELVQFSNDYKLMFFGCAGVSLFLTLSGFLSAFTYENDAQMTSCQLIKKRWKQFFNIHFLTLLIAVPLFVDSYANEPVIWSMRFVANLSLIQAFFPSASFYFSFNGVAWYLSMVLFMAMVTPITVKILKRISIRTAVIILVAVAVIEHVLSFLFSSSEIMQWIVYVFPVVRYLDFLGGGAVYKLAVFIKEKRMYTFNKLICGISFVFIIVTGIVSVFEGNCNLYSATWLIPSQLLVMSSYNIKITCREHSLINKCIMCFTSISLEFFMIQQLVIRYYVRCYENRMIPVFLECILIFAVSVAAAVLLHQITSKNGIVRTTA